MYRNLIRPGMRFVYYRGRKSAGGRRPQVYFGTGAIGEVGVDRKSPNRLVCEVLDYLPFARPVPFKQEGSGYLEHGGVRRGYYQRGVRVISHAEYATILLAAGVNLTAKPSKSIDVTVARQRSILRMTKTAVQTAAYANGQIISRKLKNKEILVTSEALEEHINHLLDKQAGRCAISGLSLQFDGNCDDLELLCSLDRVDSNGHYALGNLQLVCRFVNRWKAAQTDGEFRRLLTLLRATSV